MAVWAPTRVTIVALAVRSRCGARLAVCAYGMVAAESAWCKDSSSRVLTRQICRQRRSTSYAGLRQLRAPSDVIYEVAMALSTFWLLQLASVSTHTRINFDSPHAGLRRTRPLADLYTAY